MITVVVAVKYHYIILSDYAAKHLNLTHHNVLLIVFCISRPNPLSVK